MRKPCEYEKNTYLFLTLLNTKMAIYFQSIKVSDYCFEIYVFKWCNFTVGEQVQLVTATT